MKVLHVISSGGMYGAEAVILNLTHAMREAGHESVLGVFSNSAQPNLQFYERAVSDGLAANLISCKGQVDPSVPAAIRALVKANAADVVHAHGYKADLYVATAMRGLPTPLVSTCHTWYDNDLRVRLYGALDRWVLRRFSGVVAVSQNVVARLLGAGVRKDRVHLIRNGIDLRPFEAAHSDATGSASGASLAVGLVGRLAPEKGVDLFLRAAARVLVELPQTRFFVVGDGPDRASLAALIEELKIGGEVSLLGHKEDMPAFYASLDLLVSSSRQEGLPIALLEGMASSLPVIATAVGAVPTVIDQDRTGVLVDAEDVDALAAAMLSLLKDAPRRARLGSAAHALIKQEYSATRMTADYLELYRRVLQQPPWEALARA